MSEDLVLVDVEDGVACMTLNRPQARNAMSRAMVQQLKKSLNELEQNADVRAVRLRGAGAHFCAGGDIKDMAGARQADGDVREAVAALNATFGEISLMFAASPLPVVAELRGAVMGGGFGLACVADVALCDDTVRFRLPETSLGVIPAQIAPFLVERLGLSQTRRLALTGASLSASQALALGVVHEVCDDVGERAAEVCRDIMRGAPRANALTKTLLRRFAVVDQDDIAAAAQMFADAALSDEAVEGMTAFLEKRPASWEPTSPLKDAAGERA